MAVVQSAVICLDLNVAKVGGKGLAAIYPIIPTCEYCLVQNSSLPFASAADSLSIAGSTLTSTVLQPANCITHGKHIGLLTADIYSRAGFPPRRHPSCPPWEGSIASDMQLSEKPDSSMLCKLRPCGQLRICSGHRVHKWAHCSTCFSCQFSRISIELSTVASRCLSPAFVD